MIIKKIGRCHVCGEIRKLSFEHVPPKAAFNSRPVLLANFQDLIDNGPEPIKRGKTQQRGAGGYTLCEKCNSLTGHWFGPSYVEFAHQGMVYRSILKSGVIDSCSFYIYPLKVIKQIICMFLSANNPSFSKEYPHLIKFVLDHKVKYLPPSIHIYSFIVEGYTSRQSGFSIIGKTFSSNTKLIKISEIAFPPLGFVMTIDSLPPDERLCDITFFSKYDYNSHEFVSLSIALLPIHLFLPGDYRTKDEIIKVRNSNLIYKKLL